MVPRKRKFYEVDRRVASRASGFELLNGERLFKDGAIILAPPWGQWCGFRDYPERPVFLSDAKRGRVHWDFEVYCGYWFISERMKSVLQDVDPEAFAYLQCDVRLPDGSNAPVHWLCHVIRILDALDEGRSTALIGTADNGRKVYQFGRGANLIFNESVVGDSHIFRMKYRESVIICDEVFKQACKAAKVTGISFYPAADEKRLVIPPIVLSNRVNCAEVANILSQNTDLVERYRGAVARLPKPDWHDREYFKNEAVIAVDAVFKEMDGIITKLEPGISSNDRADVHRYFIDWVSGQRTFD
jgi:Protein of unknown function (DUF1629)